MKNGNHLASHPIKLGKMHVAVKNTCAFDSFLQCLCSAFCDSNSFSRYIQQSKSSLFNLVHSIVTKGVNKDAYKQRAKILVEAFSCEPLVSGVNEVNAACNVANIITSTMKEAPSVVIQALCSSPYCSYSLKQTRDVPLVQVHVHTLHTEGMRALQASVEGGLNLPPSKCFRPLQSPGTCPSPLKTEDPSTGMVRCTGVVTHTYITLERHCTSKQAQRGSLHWRNSPPTSPYTTSHLHFEALWHIFQGRPGALLDTTWPSAGDRLFSGSDVMTSPTKSQLHQPRQKYNHMS